MTTDLLESKTVSKSGSILDDVHNANDQALPDPNQDLPLSSGERPLPGERLQKGREEKGWPASQVAEELKIPAPFIDAIEHSQFEKLPSNMFARGYIRSYARLLGLDPDELITSFDHYTGDSRQNVPALTEGSDEKTNRYVSSVISISGCLTVIAALLVVGFSYYIWGDKEAFSFAKLSGTTSSSKAEVQLTSDELTDEQLPEPVIATQPSEPDQKNSDRTLQEEEPALTEVTNMTDLDDALDEVVDESSTPMASEPLLAQTARLAIQFVDDCWIQVQDMAGKTLYTDVQKGGSTLDLEVPPTIQIRFGNVPGVQSVSFNGEPVEVKATQSGRRVASLVLGSEDAG